MASVTQRINQIKQPYGGYLRPGAFTKISFQDNQQLSSKENISPSLVGLTVDYLTHYSMSKDVMTAFDISLMGAKTLWKYSGNIDPLVIATKLANNITGLDDQSIVNTAKLAIFDVWYRNPSAGLVSKTYTEINPNVATIKNIQIMVARSLTFWKKYGPITKDGFTFEGGYTDTINAGDGDYLTKDALWDFKVSKRAPTSKHTLQILVYYLMGKHSHQPIYNSIDKIGLFNPRLNVAYLKDVSEIPLATIKEVETKVIGY